VRNRLGDVLLAAGRDRDAMDHHLAALRLARDTDGRHLEMEALTGLSIGYRRRGRLGPARSHAQQAVALARRYAHRVLEGHALTALADVHVAAGDPCRAGECARRALDIQRETGHRLGEARALTVLGRAIGGAAAQAPWRAALAITVDLGVPEADRLRGLLASPVAAAAG
jgi:hypothetical protein